MSFPNEARGRLTEARNILIDRRRQTNDPKERAAIDDAISDAQREPWFYQSGCFTGRCHDRG